MTVPEAARALYRRPPEEFTAERDRLARRLRDEGDAAGADAVKALRRPSLAAYALNQVAHRRGELISDLLEAGERLRTAPSRAAMEEAKQDRTRAIGAVVAQAAEEMAGEGRALSPQVSQRLTETLLAAATDEATRARLQTGSLEREAAPGGLGGPVVAFEETPADETARRLRERVRRLREDGEAKLAEARRAREESERASREARELAEAAEAARDRAERLANVARRAEELGRAALAGADELEQG